MASTLLYHSFLGLRRSLAAAFGVSRTMSNVNLTSLDVKGWPSCQRTPGLKKKTGLRGSSCQDQRSPSPGAGCDVLGSLDRIRLVEDHEVRVAGHGRPRRRVGCGLVNREALRQVFAM